MSRDKNRKKRDAYDVTIASTGEKINNVEIEFKNGAVLLEDEKGTLYIRPVEKMDATPWGQAQG